MMVVMMVVMVVMVMMMLDFDEKHLYLYLLSLIIVIGEKIWTMEICIWTIVITADHRDGSEGD